MQIHDSKACTTLKVQRKHAYTQGIKGMQKGRECKNTHAACRALYL